MGTPTDQEITDYISKTIAERMESSFAGRPLTEVAIEAIKSFLDQTMKDIEKIGYPLTYKFQVNIDPDDPTKIWIEDEESYLRRMSRK